MGHDDGGSRGRWLARGLSLLAATIAGCAEPASQPSPLPPAQPPLTSAVPTPAATPTSAPPASAEPSRAEKDWAAHCRDHLPQAPATSAMPVTAVDRAPFRAGTVVAYVRPDMTEAQAQAAAASVGGSIASLGNGWRMPAGVQSRVPKFTEIAVPAGRERAAAQELGHRADVVSAWLDYARVAPSPLRSGLVLRRGAEAWEAGALVVGFRPGPTSSKEAVDELVGSLGYAVVQYGVAAQGVQWALARVVDCEEDAAAARVAAEPAVRFAEKNRLSRVGPRR